MQIFQETRLINRHQRAQAHRNGWKLPELRQRHGMRVGRKAGAAGLLTKAQQLRFAEPPLDKSAGIDSGRRVALDVDQVAAMLRGRCAPEMAEAYFGKRRRRLKTGDMPPQLG